ncbi:hypothetical protein PG994_012893 [Apiospora phragmitis]|uniref:ABC transmembrane type-1 domain-containing protein n=1 Tax=Apiospora phragmitis TaxID=2905665 RepID=A0ABR1T8U1_9PEZI
MTSQALVLTQALGAVLGYIGSEVAEVTTFERLLWPERFYNDASLPTILKQSLFMTMGGPLHSAALKTLDVFRTHGLYRGPGRGNLLGTAFYSDLKAQHTSRITASSPGHGTDDQVRNGFWVEVLRQLDKQVFTKGRVPSRSDIEKERVESFRAIQAVHHLQLRLVSRQEKPKSRTVILREDKISWKTLLGVVISETVTVIVTIIAAILTTWWVALFMVIPLVLKLSSLLFHTRREGLRTASESTKKDQSIICEIRKITQGFFLIEGPVSAVEQFFRHYGHPLRSSKGDRRREVLCISVTYAFVLYYPAGLVLSIWMDDTMQYLWLAYQLYAVLAMHILRLLDWQGSGRTEYCAAKHLSRDREVWLRSSSGDMIAATVRTDFVPKYSEGERLVQERFAEHANRGS